MLKADKSNIVQLVRREKSLETMRGKQLGAKDIWRRDPSTLDRAVS
jgi:hypothetical protein